MAIEHIVLLEWNESTTEDQIQECIDGLRALKENIPGIQSIRAGTNFSERAGNITHAAVITMEDKAALDGYGPHPAHQELLKTLGPALKNITVVDFEA